MYYKVQMKTQKAPILHLPSNHVYLSWQDFDSSSYGEFDRGIAPGTDDARGIDDFRAWLRRCKPGTILVIPPAKTKEQEAILTYGFSDVQRVAQQAGFRVISLKKALGIDTDGTHQKPLVTLREILEKLIPTESYRPPRTC